MERHTLTLQRFEPQLGTFAVENLQGVEARHDPPRLFLVDFAPDGHSGHRYLPVERPVLVLVRQGSVSGGEERVRVQTRVLSESTGTGPVGTQVGQATQGLVGVVQFAVQAMGEVDQPRPAAGQLVEPVQAWASGVLGEAWLAAVVSPHRAANPHDSRAALLLLISAGADTSVPHHPSCHPQPEPR